MARILLDFVQKHCAGFGALWLPSLALGGIALAVIALAWIRLRLES